MLPKMTYWDSTVKPFPFDLGRARQALASSSVPKGFTVPYVYTATDAAAKQVATILQQQWAQVGVKADLQGVDSATWSDRLGKGDFGIAGVPVDGFTSDVPNDDELAIGLFDSKAGFHGFSTNYTSSPAAALAHRANAALDPAVRRKLFGQLQRFGMSNPPWIPLFFVPQLTAVRHNVQGLKTINTGWWRLEDVSLAR
jgi:peptide/nickel transport system substrate-binding protein